MLIKSIKVSNFKSFKNLDIELRDFNLIIGHRDIDPVSGSVPLRAYLCQIHRLP